MIRQEAEYERKCKHACSEEINYGLKDMALNIADFKTGDDELVSELLQIDENQRTSMPVRSEKEFAGLNQAFFRRWGRWENAHNLIINEGRPFEAEGTFSGYRVLLSDDEPDLAKAIQFILQDAGNECCVSLKPQDTVEKYFEFKPHLLITDITKPNINGFDMMRLFKADIDRQLPIVIVSATMHDIFRVARGFALGADDVLSKPFTGEILRRLKNVMEKRKAAEAELKHALMKTKNFG